MACVIAFANQKGGVRKSTLSVQLAYYLRLKLGKRVLMIDMDAQGNSSKTLLELKDGERIAEKLLSSTSDCLFDKDATDITIQGTPRGIDLIGSDQSASGYDVERYDLATVLLPKKNLRKCIKEYDYVIIDCPPGLGVRLVGSLVMADYVVCPVKLSGYFTDSLSGLFTTIKDLQGGPNRRLKVLGIAINEYKETAPQRETLLKANEEFAQLPMSVKVFKSMVRSRSPIDVATRGKPIFEVRGGQRATEELHALFEEILAEIRAAES